MSAEPSVMNALEALHNNYLIGHWRNHPIEFIFEFLIFSVVVGLIAGYRGAKAIDTLQYYAEQEEKARSRAYERLWNTPHWWVLAMLVDQWLRGLIPGDGMWTRDNARSLRQKDKSALQQLVRMGIFPLYIQDGHGPRTVVEREGKIDQWGRVTPYVYKQSSQRAVFEFVVPRARGWMIEDENVMSADEHRRRKDDEPFMAFVQMLVQSKRIRRAARWRTTASAVLCVNLKDLPKKQRERRQQFPKARMPFPLRPVNMVTKFPPDPELPTEIGNTSWFRYLLPFKRDRILCGGYLAWKMEKILHWLRYGKLLTEIRLPIVRIEAPEDDEVELDKEVLLIAQNLDLDQEGWDETLAKLDLRRAYFEEDIEPLE
ncbi:hypothetical protein BU23DRAFT_565567 [Bimuria novae-zelandiae CBS 107.79]|uniref:Uncharacterized protein n=1 Tax=Bimuria novae-zelandiae CBS 107.79 TaxID=1447943 RepID=A0A6A5VJS2_9PLEO|nr:hypothetical protein BU23DRAFT_565567 [Bimuria novae-zelandiae CBS 107.79]